jgi:DEAD/DEAH box helicase domain-containing protein
VNRQLGIRRSSVNESRRVALEFIERDLKTLVFANSRLASDLLVTYLKDEFRPSLAESVTRLSRRHLPRGGKSSGASATAKPPPGLPPTRRSWALISARSMASSWWVIRGPSPRAGSAPDAPGGDGALSAAVILASSAALDQYIIEHPHYFFGRFSKHAFTNSQNLEILIAHLTCAAFVLPIRDDERFGPHPISEVCRLFWKSRASCTNSAGAWHWISDTFPADATISAPFPAMRTSWLWTLPANPRLSPRWIFQAR